MTVLEEHKLERMAWIGNEEVPRCPMKDQLAEAIAGAVLGTEVSAVMDDIKAAHERGHLNDEDAESLALAAAEKGPQLPYRPEDMRLSAFAESGLVCEVQSKVLGENVLWAADNAVVPPDSPLVVYRASELRAAWGMSPERLRAVHAVKKAMDGDIVAADEEGEAIPVDDLLNGPGNSNACYACGQTKWWDNNGRRVCAVCHPPPRGDRSGKAGDDLLEMLRGQVSER